MTTTPAGDAARRELYATAIRDRVRFRLGASVLALAQQGRPLKMSFGEAEVAADAAVAVADAEMERLRTENERMRHELEVMYGGAFDSPKPAPADRAAVLSDVERAVQQVRRNCAYDPAAGCDFCNGVDASVEAVRRMADEAQQPETAETEAAKEPCGLWGGCVLHRGHAGAHRHRPRAAAPAATEEPTR
ncbi:hypothetical protein ACWEAF_05940 [Streptomyces sp. NPDC005071]